MKLFENRISDGEGTAIHRCAGDAAVLFVSGEFDGATVGLEVSGDNGNSWVPVSSPTLIAPGVEPFRARPGMLVRATLASAGESTSVTVSVL